MTSVIVFGPTGKSGSVAARTAADLGAEVWLAMRDTSKAIPGLSKEAEESGDYHRVTADLQNPDTIIQAIKRSGAKRAFIYLAHGSQDHMRSTIEALKSAGVQFVVFLSSFTILTNKALREIPSTDLIPFWHAQVEASLDDIFGENYVAVRCGAFITNLMQEKEGIMAGKVAMLNGGVFQQDNITPDDIGRVMGSILVDGPKKGQRKVYVYGPKIRSSGDSIVAMGKVLGKDVQVTSITPEQAYDRSRAKNMPEGPARYLIEVTGTSGRDKDGQGTIFPNHEEGVKNVELYTGKPAQSLEAWTEGNRALFGG